MSVKSLQERERNFDQSKARKSIAKVEPPVIVAPQVELVVKPVVAAKATLKKRLSRKENDGVE